MNEPLPTHIGGYQHLEPDVKIQLGDIYVDHGVPMGWCFHTIGGNVGLCESTSGWNIYRKMPVAHQADSHEREFGQDVTVVTGPTGPAAPQDYIPTTLPSDAAERKRIPIYSGFLKYFPRACAEVARVSLAGNDQHNPGKPLHWDRSKSGDELDALSRHLLEAGTFDTDGIRHSAKLAWRGMANLEKELEAAETKKE